MENIYRLATVQKLLRVRRKMRIRFLLSKVEIKPNMQLLDIGCGPDGRSLENYLPDDFNITGIDLYDEENVNVMHPSFTYLKQDASDMSVFKNNEFDLAVSIGMMEHICNFKVLRKMASEIDRIAQQYIIVVPWKYAWIEPHFKVPFFQLLPLRLQVLLTRLLNLHNLKKAITTDSSVITNNYQWLTNSEWKEIFPGTKAYLCPTLDTIALVKRT